MSIVHEMSTNHASAAATIAENARELRKAADQMVRDARRADEKMGRTYDPKSYITVDRIVTRMADQTDACFVYCGCRLLYGKDINRCKNKDAATLERIDSNVAHVADNCILACMSCNRSKGYNIPFDVMKQWAVPIKRGVAKWCNSCQTVKCVAQFGRDRSTRDKLDYRCKGCNTIHCVQT